MKFFLLLKHSAFFIIITLLSSCFFVPSMNLHLKNQPVTKQSEINNIKINLHTIDQSSIKLDATTNKQNTQYKLGEYDIISIVVWGHPEFSTSNTSTTNNDAIINNKLNPIAKLDATLDMNRTRDNKPDIYIIDIKGNIYLPFVGNIKISELTVDEARNKIQKAMKDYIVNPNINIKVIGFRSKKIYVMGEVQQSQMLALTDLPLNLPAALESVGWINYVTANVNQIYVLRKGDNCVDAFWLDGSSVTAMLYAQSFYLMNNDIVFVSTAGLSQFNRVMGQILPTAQTIWYTKSTLPSTALPGVLN